MAEGRDSIVWQASGADALSAPAIERSSSSSGFPRSEASSSTRALRIAQEAASLFEELLAIACELPVESGVEAVGRTFVERLGHATGFSVGLCLVVDGESQEFLAPAMDTRSAAHAIDPTRLFASSLFERILPLDAAGDVFAGSTLHIAGDDPLVLEDGTSFGVAMARGAHVLAKALASCERQLRHDRRMLDVETALRELDARLAQADKLASFGEIAACVVHELNNPLTSIVAYTDYLLRKAERRAPADVDEVERLRRIRESANRLLYFTRDLIAYARPSSDPEVAVPVRHAIEQALEYCEHVIDEAGADVICELDAGEAAILGVPQQLVQVFVNLITNACHALPAHGGRIRITANVLSQAAGSAQGERVCIRVEDNGHGIDSEHIPRLFTPFFTTKGEGRGTGLGLPIVKRIVEKCGGEVQVESAVDRGATFSLTFPRSFPRA
jgi:signal transduction histidine kinase